MQGDLAVHDGVIALHTPTRATTARMGMGENPAHCRLPLLRMKKADSAAPTMAVTHA